jgi:2-oxoglutarate-Fe(II)-dependent oxygenase superfamily protein
MSQPSVSNTGQPESLQLVSAEALGRTTHYHEAFVNAQPFRHVLIDGFFAEHFAERLLADFPPFDPALLRNELYGAGWGGKVTNPKIRAIAPVYQQLYGLIASRAFLDWMGEVTGIPDLLFDPAMFGGGTHENLHGQDLDPHVDFNYDEAQQLHRRLNLILYLNKDWRMEWGGALELHSNPRKPDENQCVAFNPIFNRAVLFETNERSWHGFPKIELPPEERHRSRKSVSIYLYTRERPAEEIAPLHGTFYVQRPLPDWVRPGHVLSEDECRGLRHAVDRRDKWIEIYQKMELSKSGQVAQHAAYVRDMLSRVRAPFTGYVMQEGLSEGLYADGWARPHIRLQIRPLQPVTGLRLRGWRPESAPPGSVTVRLNQQTICEGTVGGGLFEVELRGPGFPIGDTARLDVECQPPLDSQGDDRELALVLIEIRAEHG